MKWIFSLSLILAFSVSCVSTSALAFENSQESFEHLVDRISHFQPSNPETDEFIFDKASFEVFTPEQKRKIEAVVEEQINIWGDTILEGDYALIGEQYTIYKLFIVRNYGKSPLAIKVLFNQAAVDTSTCQSDIYKHPENTPERIVYQDCVWGHIFDQIYITPDFTGSERDTLQFEYFN